MKPKIFTNCYNYSDACPNTEMIRNEFAEKIELIEIKSPDDRESNVVNIGKTVMEISESYCQNCDNFSLTR